MRNAIIITAAALALAACSGGKTKDAHADASDARQTAARDNRTIDAMAADPKVSYQQLQAEAQRRNVQLTPDQLASKQIQDAGSIRADPSLMKPPS